MINDQQWEKVKGWIEENLPDVDVDEATFVIAHSRKMAMPILPHSPPVLRPVNARLMYKQIVFDIDTMISPQIVICHRRVNIGDGMQDVIAVYKLSAHEIEYNRAVKGRAGL